jgi:cobalt-zinc-cadmium efflux system membrane fusion protein
MKFTLKTMGLSLLLFCLLWAANPLLRAHGGDEHGNKNEDQGAKSNSFEILKETQFLYGLRTSYPIWTDSAQFLKLYAHVLPSENGQAEIIAPMDGKVVSMNVSVGSKVTKGQVVATVEQNNSAIDQMSLAADKVRAEAEIAIAKQDLERFRKIDDIVAKKELVHAEMRLKQAQEALDLYKNLSANNGKLFQLRAPISGTVDNFNLALGQEVRQSELLFKVFNLAKVKVEAEVHEKDLKRLDAQRSFMVTSEESMDFAQKARFISMGNQVNPVNQTVLLILEMDNADGQLRPGQFVNVGVMGKTEERRVCIPTSSIIEVHGISAVFVHTTPEMFELRPIVAGEENGIFTTIKQGLHESDRVVVQGAYRVKTIYQNQ